MLSCTSQPAAAPPLLLKIATKKTTREEICGTQMATGTARWEWPQESDGTGEGRLQHASDAIDLRLNELVGKYVITLSHTRQGQF